MIGFGKVGQLEINCKGLGDAISIIHRKASDQVASLGHQCVVESRSRLPVWNLLTMLDQQTAQALHCVEKGLAFLLNQNAPEQHAKEADIPAQGLLLNRSGRVGGEFG